MAAVILRNAYGDLTEARQIIGLAATDASKDTALVQSIRSASRAIDSYCHRRFYVSVQTQFYTATSAIGIELPQGDDLLTVTSLKTDNAWDQTYGTTWSASTDYNLAPYNARTSEPPKPYKSILVRPNTGNYFVLVSRGVQIVGTWGFDDSTEDLSVTLQGGGVNASATSWTLSDASAYSAGDRMLCESEQVLVTDVNANVLTVQRGYNGFTAASHVAGVSVVRYIAPWQVKNAWRRLTNKFYRADSAPFGVSGAQDFGTQQVGAPWDRELRALLDEFVDWTAG